jgi:carboxypeptidase Taq
MMRQYLSLTPPDAAHGVLQDVHWAGGAIGYFPTYALGNIIAAQLWEQVVMELPEVNQQIRHGNFSELRQWLSDKIYRHGAKFEPQDLVTKATGRKIDPAPYLRYLKTKYKEIYSL